MEAERQKLNELILGTDQRVVGMHSIFGLNIHARLPLYGASIAARAGANFDLVDTYEERWADDSDAFPPGYPTPDGYEVIAEVVAKEIVRCWKVFAMHPERKARMEGLYQIT
jgi:hypothetical protein